MKIKGMIAGLVLALGVMVTGCKTVDGESVPDTERIAAVAREAALQGTEEALLQHPDWMPGFQYAHAELVALERADRISAADLLAVISRLPVKELKSEEARIAIRGARLLIAITGWSEIDAERLAQIRPIVTAIREGLEEGGVIVPVAFK